MHILVTNDDGIHAPGLLALAQALRPLGNVTVLAPDRNWSASGHVKTLDRPLRVRPAKLADGSDALTTDGAPSDCVALPLLGLLDRKVDLVVSGINPWANLGHDVTYSGTVTAAMEAAIGGLPGIAVSLNTAPGHQGERDYAPAAEIARRVAVKVMEKGLPRHTLVSVNVPYRPLEDIKGVHITRQGLRVYRDELVRRTDPHGNPYYWIGGEFPDGVPDDGTDFGALAEGYVSITPLQLDMTAYAMMDELRGWEWE
ncbi:MAG: 5'/3'-nucleotidase SurE [Anaerolineae bacterium]|nr:MAG: 5'/3'-nucleotidase SurE [Anaerolineae bacterium]